jgi:hypothetical protein
VAALPGLGLTGETIATVLERFPDASEEEIREKVKRGAILSLLHGHMARTRSTSPSKPGLRPSPSCCASTSPACDAKAGAT